MRDALHTWRVDILISSPGSRRILYCCAMDYSAAVNAFQVRLRRWRLQSALVRVCGREGCLRSHHAPGVTPRCAEANRTLGRNTRRMVVPCNAWQTICSSTGMNHNGIVRLCALRCSCQVARVEGCKALWELRRTFGAPLWPMPRRCMVNRYVLVELVRVAGRCRLFKCESVVRTATCTL